jgi:hypothetical protein
VLATGHAEQVHVLVHALIAHIQGVMEQIVPVLWLRSGRCPALSTYQLTLTLIRLRISGAVRFTGLKYRKTIFKRQMLSFIGLVDVPEVQDML